VGSLNTEEAERGQGAPLLFQLLGASSLHVAYISRDRRTAQSLASVFEIDDVICARENCRVKIFPGFVYPRYMSGPRSSCPLSHAQPVGDNKMQCSCQGTVTTSAMMVIIILTTQNTQDNSRTGKNNAS
jgi:hypothetical protein